jgi:hypothetical protein
MFTTEGTEFLNKRITQAVVGSSYFPQIRNSEAGGNVRERGSFSSVAIFRLLS